MKRYLYALIGSCLAAAFACSARPPSGARNRGDADSGTGSTGSIDFDSAIDDPILNAPPTANCGDGTLDDDEACDDSNLDSGDGCGGNCRYIEPGFVCPDPGQLCHAIAKCGDGILVFPEQCDDGGVVVDDGCSATCKVEIGFKCDGSPSTCTPTVCGDGLIEGAETCDDSNRMPFDGCSTACQAEPECTADGCSSACGDGLIIGDEGCDDGNTLDGDGCSSGCTEEAGYVCAQDDTCEMVAGECVLRLPIIYRDFSAAHSDFGVGCGTHVLGVTGATLNAAAKPTLAITDRASVCIASAASFGEWYTRASNNAEILEEIVLFDNGNGGFVNRLNNEGARYTLPPPNPGYQWCSNSSDQCDACPAGYTECLPTCTPWGSTATCALYPTDAPPVYIDGNPLFFPIDNHPDALADTDQAGFGVASIPQEVYGGNWAADPSGAIRNFHFTSEIAYWFEYHTGDTANLTFVGDDDVWVYVNRRLAVDLGGLHVPIEGSFTINADGSIDMIHGAVANTESSTVAGFGMVDGGVYEIKVFHAERKKTGSSFKLTLSGFNTSRSDCNAVCGDGIIAAGEQCDDGTENNIGGHNRCSSDCTIGAYCGDGVMQEPEEQCDDNDPAAAGNCAGCRLIVLR
jgi:fibro-slime domain-containing protein